MKKVLEVLFLLLSVSLSVSGQKTDQKEPKNPFGIQGVAANKSLKEIRQEINRRLSNLKPDECRSPNHERAVFYSEIAELMKRVGDYRAEEFYDCAIKADPTDAVYEYLFAEYLRNFRGAQHPLFPKAEKHYFDSLRKLSSNPAIGDLVERGLVALYVEDGIPIAHREFEIPAWFFSSINNGGRSTLDSDRVDDTRSFTSEALFAASRARLSRDLTEPELKQVIRVKDQFETLNRSRFRYKNFPALDVFYRHREIEEAQITDFRDPTRFNDVRLNEYGVAVEKPLDLAPYFDAFLRGSYHRIDRQGLLETQPNAYEHINQFEATAVLSRFAGPDKINFEFVYAYQDINPDGQPRRDRSIVGGKFTYQLFRTTFHQVYNRRFETRGVDFFAGALHDSELFGKTDVNKNDLFIGAAIKGIGRFDFTVQPTVFNSDVEGDKSQKNSQYRTNITMLFRIFDEEKQAGNPAFLHLVFPFRHDLALRGTNAFENFKAGIGFNAKFFTRGSRRTTFLASLRYDYQQFSVLKRTLNLVGLSLSIGF